MKHDLILAGVGGQGILSIAYVLDNAAINAGLTFKQAEVHGMAQRGGAVQSHLRYSDQTIHSDLIPHGRADMVLSVEPLEVMRYWQHLRPQGWVVTSVTPYVNVPDYPDEAVLLDQLAEFPNLVLVDSGQLAKAAGSQRAQNMVVLGAAAPLLELPERYLVAHITSLFAAKGERIVEVNTRAFALGQAAGRFFRGLVDAGMDPVPALRVCQKMAPDTIDPDRAAEWAAALAQDRARLDVVLAAEAPWACSEIPTFAR
jgi:indolepyruvate ferredoxin oxidoreductase, beta subunit